METSAEGDLRSSASPLPLLAQLRHATHAAHVALDQGLSLVGSGITRERYLAFLEGTFAVVGPLEARVFPILDVAEALADAETRHKAPALLADFGALARAVTPLAVTLPSVDTLAQAFGCAYVLEGSTLGGAVLARPIEQALGLHAEAGTSYFHVYGDRLGARWKGFLEALSAFEEGLEAASRALACAAACASATETFAAFTRAFHARGLLKNGTSDGGTGR